jgi:hypothetical protein
MVLLGNIICQPKRFFGKFGVFSNVYHKEYFLISFKAETMLLQCVNHNCYLLFIYRNMKSMSKNANSLFNNIAHKERVSGHIQEYIGTMFKEPLKNKKDILDRNANYFCNNTLGENICKQTISKGFFPRYTAKKEDILLAIRNNAGNRLSGKLSVNSSKENSDFRFFNETLTASQFAETSPSIKQIIMNSENVNVAVIAPSGSNKFPDVTVNINGNFVMKDIKSGNKIDAIFSDVLAEIPYNE